jgi:predicted MFS family arabinose efflux permease
MLAVAGGMFSVFYFASIYLQQTLDFSPIQTGLAFLPLTAGIIVFSGIAQQIVARVGVREVAMVGMGVAAIGLLLLSRAPVDGTYVADVLPGLLAMSAGLGLTFVPLTLIATTGVSDADAGLASGIFNSSQQIGGALGLAILSTVAATQTTSALDKAGSRPSGAQQASALVDGFQAAFAIGAGLMLLGVILAAVLIRRRDVAILAEAPSVVPGA